MPANAPPAGPVDGPGSPFRTGGARRAPNPSLAAPEAFHVVGAAGEPGFLNAWAALGPGSSKPGFYKDPLGVVHLQGSLTGGIANNNATGNMFILPVGYRPADGQQFSGGDATGTGQIAVTAAGEVRALTGAGSVLLTIDGFTFRAGA